LDEKRDSDDIDQILTMVESDSSFSATALQSGTFAPVRTLRKRKAPPAVPVTARKSARNSVNNATKKNVKLPTDTTVIKEMESVITKQLKGQDIDKNLSLRVVRAALALQRGYLERKKRAGESDEHTVPAPGFATTFARCTLSRHGRMVRSHKVTSKIVCHTHPGKTGVIVGLVIDRVGKLVFRKQKR
jgi:hypothetical protein